MQAGEGYLLAVDIGTTTTRCILFDLEGMPVAKACREPRIHHPQINWTEVEPEDWWDATVAVIRETLQRAEVPSAEILGVGLCGLQHALVPIDSEGRSLSRSMLWMDQRCRPQVEWLVREHRELVEEIIDKPLAFSTTSSALKLRWIVENEPDLVRQTHKFLLVKDFIRFRLAGTVATDPYDAAGTCLFDGRTGEWSHRMLELIGVPRDKMPPIHDSTQVVGGVTEEAAQATGLAPGTPVVIGSGDVLCTCIGANAFDFGELRLRRAQTSASSDFGELSRAVEPSSCRADPKPACLYLGTAAWISVPGTRGRTIGATATTGASLKWLAELLGIGDLQCSDSDLPLDSSYTAFLQEAESVPPGSRGLIFLPHLMGERGPQHDPEAKGVLFGLTLAHGRSELARAVLEGCAFQLRRILENPASFGIGEMVAVGGGAKSTFWLSIIADVTGIPLLVPRVLEAGALGAAILAGVGVGVYPGVREAAEALVQIVSQHKPDRARQDLYTRIYAIFLDLENRVAPLYGRVPV